MADVFEATDERLQRQVAVKVFRAEPSADRRASTARSACWRPSTIPASSGCSTPASTTASAFVVLELVEGPTLADAPGRWALPPDEVAELGSRSADALAYIHEHGVVHRDVNPSNILCDPEGRPRLVDFGIAGSSTPPGHRGRHHGRHRRLHGPRAGRGPRRHRRRRRVRLGARAARAPHRRTRLRGVGPRGRRRPPRTPPARCAGAPDPWRDLPRRHDRASARGPAVGRGGAPAARRAGHGRRTLATRRPVRGRRAAVGRDTASPIRRADPGARRRPRSGPTVLPAVLAPAAEPEPAATRRRIARRRVVAVAAAAARRRRRRWPSPSAGDGIEVPPSSTVPVTADHRPCRSPTTTGRPPTTTRRRGAEAAAQSGRAREGQEGEGRRRTAASEDD